MTDRDERPERCDTDEPRRIRPKYRCHDRMCGAEDCATCHPNTWRQAMMDDDSEQRQDDQ